MIDRSYVVMDRLPGNTLNELTYRRPEVLDTHQVTISYQLGMHMAFSYVFGSKDGYQTNYIFDPVSRILTRIDKESFFEVPDDPHSTLDEGDKYTQEIAVCELSNLKYIPSFRAKESRRKVVLAFQQGFLDKYSDIKAKKTDLIHMVKDTRKAWVAIECPADIEEYAAQTIGLLRSIDSLIEQEPQKVFDRLVAAKREVDSGGYNKG